MNGAGGVTGLLLVALGAIRGARVIATASPAGHDRLRRLGAERVFDYHDAGWVREARGIAGAGVERGQRGPGPRACRGRRRSGRRTARDDHVRSADRATLDSDRLRVRPARRRAAPGRGRSVPRRPAQHRGRERLPLADAAIHSKRRWRSSGRAVVLNLVTGRELGLPPPDRGERRCPQPQPVHPRRPRSTNGSSVSVLPSSGATPPAPLTCSRRTATGATWLRSPGTSRPSRDAPRSRTCSNTRSRACSRTAGTRPRSRPQPTASPTRGSSSRRPWAGARATCV